MSMPRPSMAQLWRHVFRQSNRMDPWRCRQCVSRFARSTPSCRASYSTRTTTAFVKPRRRQRIILASATGTVAAGITVLGLSGELNHYYEATQRSTRVLTALYACIKDYKATLRDPPADAEECDAQLRACHKRCAIRTLRVLEKNGSIFIKLGQHISSMGYLLPVEWTETFVPLQDRCPVSSYESIAAMFEKDTGVSIEDYFESFDPIPLGSASLAQVHHAVLNGQEVAVKVQHPELEAWVPLDMALTRFCFRTTKRFFPEYDLSWLSDEMSVSLPQELDFRCEARNAERTKAYFARIPATPLVIPGVSFSSRRILIMDYITGHRPDDLEYLDAHGIDRDEVAAALARIFNEMIFGNHAPLHCDPHGGNLAIRENASRRRPRNFDVVLYDHGLYRDIPLQLKRDYARLWLAVLDANEADMRTYAQKVAGITDEQFPLFASAITGREYAVVTSSVVSSRTASEKAEMSDALGDGLIPQLVQLLASVPRIILLILKTNDLTRSLDENLCTRQGPVRSFLILARYCSRTVFEEQLECIRAELGSSLWRPQAAWRVLVAWSAYTRVRLQLRLYEWYLRARSALGLAQMDLSSQL